MLINDKKAKPGLLAMVDHTEMLPDATFKMWGHYEDIPSYSQICITREDENMIVYLNGSRHRLVPVAE